MLAIVDYGMGNLGSLLNVLKKIGAKAVISSDPTELLRADKLIIPGIGAFDDGMRRLQNMGILNLLKKKVYEEQTPLIGICLGAQLLTNRSEEGTLSGLGWIDAETVRFKFPEENNNLKIPHIGWNQIEIRQDNSLLGGLDAQSRFYFAHSFYIKCKDQDEVIATSTYGVEFAAAVNKGNIWGVQFHPEKSHKHGLRVIKNFYDL